MVDDWVELTPAGESIQEDYAKGKIQVNLANATSIWPMANGFSEIWFFAAGDDARRFYVRETPTEILALRKRHA
ncbi:hypothetical protein [Bosea vaviloviae]|uniref:Uncharacterized protein n=1 Tax=Bosea vaviloviae TaxID=1526658 RepID=A0A0N1F7I8_9HYPH|nr:hypothetical protein [Bosea vaviloviae]KPH82493.1 hypothetical protein AE618_03125 [Bosea vaviloviae]